MPDFISHAGFGRARLGEARRVLAGLGVDQVRFSIAKEWLRDLAVNFALDLLCWVLPPGQRFELIIEPEGDLMVAILRETNDQ